MEYFWIILAICGLSGGVVLLVLMSDPSDAITDEPILNTRGKDR